MRFLLVGILFLLLSACLSEPDCIITATNNVKISLKKITSDSVNFVKFTSISISGADSVINSMKDSVSFLNLPVNPRTGETTFKFQYKKKVNAVNIIKTDSVTLSYVTQTIIISPSCGGFVYYTNLAVISTSFATIPKVKFNQLSTSATVHTNLEIKL